MKTLTYFKSVGVALFMLLVFSFFSLNAQNQFENPGFEDWEAITDQFEEPVEWSTIKTCIPENIAGLAPVPLEKETENVHSGSAALKLITKETMAGAANGMITNGRVFASLIIEEGYTFIDPQHEEWHTLINKRPDSIVGWFRCEPQQGDWGMMKVILASDSTAVPATDSSVWVGYAAHDFPAETVTEWTRFSFPFIYYNNETPKYIHATLTSSRGFDATEGSVIWFDDLSLVYNPNNAIQEITDKDFNLYTIRKDLFLYVETAKPQTFHLKLFDIQGKFLDEKTVRSNHKETIRTNLSPGIYLAVLISEDGKKLSKKIAVN